MFRTFIATTAPSIPDNFDTEHIDSVQRFYDYWEHYLHCKGGVMSSGKGLLNAIIHGLYQMVLFVQNIFDKIFGVFGIFGELNKDSSGFHKFYVHLQELGVAVAIMLIVILVVCSLIGKQFQYKTAVVNAIIIMVVTLCLPLGVSKLSQTTLKVVTAVEHGGNTSLAIQPIQQNTVDILKINSLQWSGTLGEESNGEFNSNSIPTYNSITDKTFHAVNLADTISYNDDVLLEQMSVKDKWYKDPSNPKQQLLGNEHAKDIFTHYIKNNKVVEIKKGLLGLTDFTLPQYSRFTFSCVPIIVELIVLLVLTLVMAFKLLLSSFEIVMETVVSPIVAFSSIMSLTKWKELLMSILGGFMAIIGDVVVMALTMDLLKLVTSGTVHDKIFGEGQSGIGTAILLIVIYIAIFFGALKGVSSIERLTGVTQNDTQMAKGFGKGSMAVAAVGGAVVGGAVVGGAAKGALKGTGKGIGKGFRAIRNKHKGSSDGSKGGGLSKGGGGNTPPNVPPNNGGGNTPTSDLPNNGGLNMESMENHSNNTPIPNGQGSDGLNGERGVEGMNGSEGLSGVEGLSGANTVPENNGHNPDIPDNNNGGLSQNEGATPEPERPTPEPERPTPKPERPTPSNETDKGGLTREPSYSFPNGDPNAHLNGNDKDKGSKKRGGNGLNFGNGKKEGAKPTRKPTPKPNSKTKSPKQPKPPKTMGQQLQQSAQTDFEKQMAAHVVQQEKQERKVKRQQVVGNVKSNIKNVGNCAAEMTYRPVTNTDNRIIQGRKSDVPDDYSM